MQPNSVIGAIVLTALGFSTSKLSATDPIPVGEAAPNFQVTSTEGKEWTLESFEEAKVIVVCFTSNSCPVARSYEERFNEFSLAYGEKGVEFVAINCDPNEIADGATKAAAERNLVYRYAVDAQGESAKEYGATVTPQIFVIDKERKVAYTGPFDDDLSAPKSHYVRDAVTSLLAGKRPTIKTRRPFGCRIKLKR